MKTRGLLKSTTLVSGNTAISRILGFMRDMVIAHFFGATAGVDAFLVAFKLPNFMRRLFAEGAFSQAFVPVLSHYQTQKTHDSIKDFINRILGSMITILFPFTLLAMLFAPYLVLVFAPGFNPAEPRYHMASDMLRITFPYLFFISLTALCSAVMNTYGRYGIPAFTPVLLNICMITAAFIGYHYFAVPIHALAWAVCIAGIVQFLFQLPFLAQLNLLPLPKWGFHDPGVQRVLKLMIPALFGVSVAQISLLLDTIFASFLPIGSVSWLYYSDRLMNFPLGIFGVGIATVILPYLSRHRANQNQVNFCKTLDWALRMLLLIGIPSSIGLIILSGPLLTTLLQYGKFTPHDVLMARQSLIAFAIGIQGFMSIKVLAAGFYAEQNIKTPVKIAAIAMCSNILLNLALIFPLKHAGLALATSLSGYINTFLLLALLIRKKIYIPQAGWKKFALQLCLANGSIALLLFFTKGSLNHWLQLDWLWRSIHLSINVASAVLLYVIMLRISGLRFNDLRMNTNEQ